LLLLTAFALIAQQPHPTCNHCSASYIPAAELKAYLDRAPALAVERGVSDQQVRAVDIGKSHVDVGVVYRPKLTARSPVAEHDLVSEVYHIMDGEADLVTGPDIEGLETRPSTNNNVRNLNGPGSNGTSIRGGVTHHLKAGDVIVIPAGVGHWFTRIDDHIRYLIVRIDPDKVTPLKDEAASRQDLRKP
jgi:mannose-6-phosphate isomerase-like protein (cupin superfamily)